VGNGLLLWFVVDDFDAASARAQDQGAEIHESRTPTTARDCVLLSAAIRTITM
jgi:predicted enzyme related to lactoylglutathione lyase